MADEGDQVRDIAAVIGRRLGLPVQPVPAQTYGPLGPIFSADQPSSSTHTQQALGWQPKHPSLLDDLENIQPWRADTGSADDGGGGLLSVGEAGRTWQ